MPVPLWTPKQPPAEARYNVTTEFPSLGLHSAAASGNVGLVEYALTRGQPINSVLDGVLPLHAAAAGGSEQIVKLLIERGADVNAPRLPRRYSNDKNRDAAGPIVGTSGSTPLHFAAANGNSDIVTTLLLRGARADRADKHGVTAEMLARQHGWNECADILQQWVLNKDRDLREREPPVEFSEPTILPLCRLTSRDRDGSPGDTETSTRKRIHMKRSMDTALSMLKSSSEVLKPPSNNLPMARATPPSPIRPFGEYTFYPTSGPVSPIDPSSRRPSLPQISYPAPPSVNRKASLASRTPRRPRSAGNGAEPETPPFGRVGQAEGSSPSSGVPLERTSTQTSISNPSGLPSPTNNATQMTDSVLFAASPTRAMSGSPSRPPMPLAVDLHNALAQHQRRDRSGSAASAPFESEGISGSPSSLSRLAVLRPRERSGSRGSSAGNRSGSVFDDDVVITPDGKPRAGILRAHNRSNSGPVPPGLRALRFDPEMTTSRKHSPGPPSSLGLRGSTSAGSLSRLRNETSNYGTPDSAPAAVSDFDLEALKTFMGDDEEEDLEYGQQMSPPVSPGEIQPCAERSFPFSIHEAPRSRGASVSSAATTDSQVDLQVMSASSTTSGSGNGSVAVTTPPPSAAQTLMPPAAEGGRITERRTPTPLDINLSLISSHAQAEALVQKELKDILSMGKNGAGVMPLSAKLAAYGESLQIERKFRTDPSPSDDETILRLPRTTSSSSSQSSQSQRESIQRQHSFDGRTRQSNATADDEATPTVKVVHHLSRSTSAILSPIPIVVQTSVTAAQVVDANNRVRRARTPDPDAATGLSRVSSLDGYESADVELGPALTRVSTAPMMPTTATRDRDRARNLASANKLTRMGFAPQQIRPDRQDPSQSKRFGFKSLMQTFKGKT
ncbi:unnamed protein product [Mycena citricolor]|uniref:Ankyrin n=1 Tax=Mycena citricolor TaxID=2018698 RepID=A0AAD2Q6H7_9AGAR|nr:unnamed protein product [Mycena citricolor]